MNILFKKAAGLIAGIGFAVSPIWAQTIEPQTYTADDGTTFTYNIQTEGYELTVQDTRGVTTRFLYNALGQEIEENSAERGVTQSEYDDNGNLIRQTRAGGLVYSFSYDEQNRVVREIAKERGLERKVHRYTYDSCNNGVGRLCRVATAEHVTRYDYTESGQMARVRVRYTDNPKELQTTRFAYDDAGRLIRLFYPTGLVVRYVHNSDGHITKVTGRYNTGQDRRRFVIAQNVQFDPVSDSDVARLAGLTYGNGLRQAYAYNEAGALTRSVLRGKDGTRLDRAIYQRDTDGRVSQIVRDNPKQSVAYSYDALGRLISERRGEDLSTQTITSYSHDGVHNRVMREINRPKRHARTQTYTYAPQANRLDQVNRQVLSYDERGNLVEDRQGRRAFTYDVTNRMTGFIKNGKLRASYAYNHQGQRIRKTLHGNGPDKNTTLYMAYAPGGVLLSEHGRNSQRQRTFARDYVWLGTRPIAQIERRIRPNGTTARARVSYIHTDHLSTPEFATDDTGTEVWRWNRDAFGVGPTLRDTDRNGIRVSINLRFPGQYHDRESGLFYNHHRDYDPHLGRYIQSDPIGLNGGINRYAYVKGNPVNYIDPLGLAVSDCFATATGIACTKLDDSPPRSYQHMFRPSSGGGGGGFGGTSSFGGSFGGSLPELIQCPNGTWVAGSAGQCPANTNPNDQIECTPELTALADAMKEALNDPRARTGEFGGLLYRLANGTIGISNRDSNGNTIYQVGGSVNIYDAHVPAGATILYGWHTHPDGSARFFSWQDFIVSQPEYARGDIRSGSPASFLGLTMGQVEDGRLFLLNNNGIDASNYLYDSATIMNFAEEITHCASNTK